MCVTFVLLLFVLEVIKRITILQRCNRCINDMMSLTKCSLHGESFLSRKLESWKINTIICSQACHLLSMEHQVEMHWVMNPGTDMWCPGHSKGEKQLSFYSNWTPLKLLGHSVPNTILSSVGLNPQWNLAMWGPRTNRLEAVTSVT